MIKLFTVIANLHMIVFAFSDLAFPNMLRLRFLLGVVVHNCYLSTLEWEAEAGGS
jgi:hypothetical protein